MASKPGWREEKVGEFLTEADRISKDIHDAWSRLGESPPEPIAVHANSALADKRAQLGEDVIKSSRVLEREVVAVERALDRVYRRTRPSHKGHVKDSMHFEHYLELSRQLQNGGHTKRRVFVSGNRDDFCETRTSPHPHFELAPDLKAAGLEYSADLFSAVNSLRL